MNLFFFLKLGINKFFFRTWQNNLINNQYCCHLRASHSILSSGFCQGLFVYAHSPCICSFLSPPKNLATGGLCKLNCTWVLMCVHSCYTCRVLEALFCCSLDINKVVTENEPDWQSHHHYCSNQISPCCAALHLVIVDLIVFGIITKTALVLAV